MRRLRIALVQMNSVVGDLDGNARRIVEFTEQARAAGADLVAFPEMALTGYPPEDLLLKPTFVADNLRRLETVAAQTHGVTSVVGFVDANTDLYNAAALIHDGAVAMVYHKHHLPNYGVFDEDRYFQRGHTAPTFVLNGTTIGINICEDIWYPLGPAVEQASAGAELIVNINASPYHIGKGRQRHRMLATRAADNSVIVAYTNLVGGQDELVFDGHALVFDQDGNCNARGRQFEEDVVIVDLDVESVFRTRLHDPRQRKERYGREFSPALTLTGAAHEYPTLPVPSGVAFMPPGSPAEIYAALVLGTRDYVRKNGFRKVLIGLSGGIDSSLVAAIAADALGPENVVGVSMPSRYSSQGSKDDARGLAEALGIQFLTIPIEGPFQATLDALAPTFAGLPSGLAEENLQARIRGNLLMALSNKLGHLVLTTGNKSEMATGYATLYGDMAGGFAVIKDLPKTLVYEVARYRNSLGPVIPPSVLTKEPSAELRPNQKDSDSLPPYDVLDPILKAYVEEDRAGDEIVAMGHDPEAVKRAIRLVDLSEYKRRQAPPGVKITARAFGRDRRLPITNRYRGYDG